LDAPQVTAKGAAIHRPTAATTVVRFTGLQLLAQIVRDGQPFPQVTVADAFLPFVVYLFDRAVVLNIRVLQG
jgi:hypothetical protein